MARIAGVDLPRGKRIEVALTYIYGIGRTRAVRDRGGMRGGSRSPDPGSERRGDQSPRRQIEGNYKVEGSLRTEVSMNIKRLMDIGCYRGLRHRRGLAGPWAADPHQRADAQGVHAGPSPGRRRPPRNRVISGAGPEPEGCLPRPRFPFSKDREKRTKAGEAWRSRSRFERSAPRKWWRRRESLTSRRRSTTPSSPLQTRRGTYVTWASAGKAGFKGSKKSTPFAATVAAEQCGREAVALGVKRVSVRVQGPGSGRESAIQALAAAGLHIKSIQDVTPLPHNGCRHRRSAGSEDHEKRDRRPGLHRQGLERNERTGWHVTTDLFASFAVGRGRSSS